MYKILFVLVANLCFYSSFAQVKTELINYNGWQNSIHLSNNTIQLIVVPQIGRILYYSYLNEDNLLYEDAELQGKVFCAEKPYKLNEKQAHAGFGGDRIWPTIQDNFVVFNGSRGLSDPWIDGSQWHYELVPNGVKITSQTSEYLGVKVTRIITLNKEGTTVNIRQKMEKVQLGIQKNREPIPVTIWSLSKVKNPKLGLLPLQENSIFENGIEFQKWPDNINSAPRNYSKHNSVGQLIPVPDLFQKMGNDSKGWVAGVYEDMIFGQFFYFDKNKTYPDGGTSATIFTCSDFTELECLSPKENLKLGEILQFNLKWKLTRIRAGTNTDIRQQAVKWLDKELSK